MHLAPAYVALAASLCLHNVFAVPVCHAEVTDTEPELYTGYGGGSVTNYCKRSAAPDSAPASAPEPEPAPLMNSDAFGLNEDGGAGDGSSDGWGGRPSDIVRTSPRNAYQACYNVYSSARIQDAEIVKRCRKAKREAEPEPAPEPLMIADPVGLGDGELGDGGSGWDFGPDLTPTDVGNAYQACYSIYSSPRVKRSLGLSESEIQKRCRMTKSKAKRTAEPDPNPDPLMISDPFGLGDGDGGLSGGDGGGPQWPGDVGDGFLQCYSVYISDRKRGVEVEGGLEKRCRKEKRDAEDEVLRRDKEKYTDYEKYGIA